MDGSRIKLLREKAGLMQEELAKIIGTAPSTIGMYERNEREPNDETKLKLAEYFNVSIDYLLGKTDFNFRSSFSKEEKEILNYNELLINGNENYLNFLYKNNNFTLQEKKDKVDQLLTDLQLYLSDLKRHLVYFTSSEDKKILFFPSIYNINNEIYETDLRITGLKEIKNKLESQKNKK